MLANTVIELHRDRRRGKDGLACWAMDTAGADHVCLKSERIQTQTHRVLKQALVHKSPIARRTLQHERIGVLEALLVGDLRLESEELSLYDVTGGVNLVACRIEA